MDQKEAERNLEKVYRLLSLCARTEGHPAFYEQLTSQISKFDAWDILPEQAELYGMAPLLWHHLKNSGLSIPTDTRQVLQGLYLRHRYFNQFHTESLIALVHLLREKGISPLVLKGLPLAYTYYPDPALRPVSDLDFLLPSEEILPALTLMESAGYAVQFPRPGALPKAVHAESPLRNNLRTHIELHHYDPKMRVTRDNSPDTEFKGFLQPPEQMDLQGMEILTPDMMEHFYYLWRHLSIHLFSATLKKPLLIKWVADIVSFVEHHAYEIDWAAIKRERPDILRRLEVFYSYSPLPSKYLGIIPVKQVPPPQGVYQYPQGWPQESFHKWKEVGLIHVLLDTFSAPTDWWLKMYYGIEDWALIFYGKVVYRAQVIYLLFWHLLRKSSV